MLAEGIAFVALRKRFLYDAQVPTYSDSPVHKPSGSLEVLGQLRVAAVLATRTPIRTFQLATGLPEMHRALGEVDLADHFPGRGCRRQDPGRRERRLDRHDRAL